MVNIPEKAARFDILDGMRGIAALAVFIRHFFMYIDLKIGNTPVLGNATATVDIFFMLSGFVIAHNYQERLKNGMAFGDYIYKRVVRLCPLVLVSLILGGISMMLFIQIGATNLSLRQLLYSLGLNVFFLPSLQEYHATTTVMEYVRTTKNQVFPSNESLWSLHFEMLVSIAFLGLFFRSTRFLAIVTGLSFVGLVLFGVFFNNVKFEVGGHTGTFVGGLPRVLYGFCMGIVIYRLRGYVPQQWTAWFIKLPYKSLLIYAAMIACFAMPIYIKGFYYLAQLLFFAPLVVFAGAIAMPENETDKKVAEYLGWLSYPIYCLHLPVLRLCYYAYEELGIEKDAWFLVVAIVVTFVATIVITKFFDEPVRRYLTAIKFRAKQKPA